MTDPKNRKVEHKAIKWEELTFPEHWVVSNPNPFSDKNITSANIVENQSSVVLSFPRRSTIDRRRIEAECKKSPLYIPPEVSDTSCSSLVHSFCQHTTLFEFAQIVNFQSLRVDCPQCHQFINLKHLAEMVIRHQNHNPRTGEAPPSTSVTPCPNPKCSDIPFPHKDEHVLVMHLVPSLQDEDPRLREMLMNMQSPKDKHGIGFYSQKYKLIPECRLKDLPTDIKGPSILEIQKFYTLMDEIVISLLIQKLMLLDLHIL